MGKIYINCSRCGKDLECEELCDVYTSKIDDSFICKDCYKKEKPDYIQQLKQQLDEKDKEIEKLKTKQKPIVMHSKENYYFLEEENIKLHFAQKQLAIKELEKVKMMTEWKFNSVVDVVEYIDNQIKELKGE